MYDCPRCGARGYQDARPHASFVTCARNTPADGRLCGETVRAKGHPVLHPEGASPGETYPSFRPGFAHLVGFDCPEHGWTSFASEERQPELFPHA